MEVVDIDKIIADREKTETNKNKPIIVIPIEDSQRIKTKYSIDSDLMKTFGIEERNSHTINLLEQTADEDDDDSIYDEPVQGDKRYYAFAKDCCCGLLRLSEKPSVYLYIKPRFPLDICSMLEQVDKSHPLWKKCLRKPKIDLVYEDVPEEYRKKLWDSGGNGLGTESKDTPCCAVSMSVLFELYAGAVIKACFSEKKHGHGWSCFFENGKANLLPTAGPNPYKYYIAGEVIPDIVLEKGGKYIILDVKYKDCDVPNRDDRLQLLAYADVYDAHVIGHIFPDKGNGCTFRSSQLNTKLGDNYHYLQFCLDDSGNVPRKLNDKIKEVIEGAGLM